METPNDSTEPEQEPKPTPEPGRPEESFYAPDQFRNEQMPEEQPDWMSSSLVPSSSDIDYEPEEEHELHEGEMGFFDHLTELRSRIIKALLGLLGGTIVAAVFWESIIEDIIVKPAVDANLKLISIRMMGQFTFVLQAAILSGLIIAIPWVIWQLWAFIKPGLYPKERRYTGWIAVATIFCFLGGCVFAYFVMIPASVKFMAGFIIGGVANQIDVSEYFSFILKFILACGVVFEMPILSFALSRFGILTPAFMKHYRKHAGVLILILAALVTPTPDPINQLMLAVPLYALYELSIFISAVGQRKRDASMEEFAT